MMRKTARMKPSGIFPESKRIGHSMPDGRGAPPDSYLAGRSTEPKRTLALTIGMSYAIL